MRWLPTLLQSQQLEALLGKDGHIIDARKLTKNGNDLSHFHTTDRLTKR